MPPDLQSLLQAAIACHQRRDLAGAIAGYQALLARAPDHPEAQANLASALRQAGRTAEALAQFQALLARDERRPEVWFNYANLLRTRGQGAAAERAYRRALSLAPALLPARLELSRLLQQQGRPEAAEALLRQGLEARPREPRLLRQLAQLAYAAQRTAEAVELYRRALAAAPDHADTLNALGVALFDLGQVEQTQRCWQQALALAPDNAAVHTNLGTLYRAQKRHQQAIAHLRQAVRLQPVAPVARVSLAQTLLEVGHVSPALAILEPLTAAHPACLDGHKALGHALILQARTEEGLAALGQARALDPAHPGAQSNYLFSSLYSDRLSAETITDRHRRLAAELTARAGPRFALAPDLTPERVLRIGYLSPDLRSHPVGLFLEPILAHHDPQHVQVTCYTVAAASDATSARLQHLAHRWCNSYGWDDERLGCRIRADGIDILIELAGHTAGNRLALMARRPAPVQALYLGYPCTSGLATIDYLIADRWVSPPERAALYSERIVTLKDSFLCFQPPAEAPAPAPAPASARGHVTFGCFNNLAKVSPSALALWAQVLQAVPGARLVLKALSLAESGTRERFRDRLARLGIAPERVDLLPPSQPLSAYLADYARIDIALDPLPYTGGTTTCEALWMGVPVVTLAGAHYYARMGVSLLNTVGLPELVATTPTAYVAIAAALAGDPERLAELRAGLRERMRRSPLCDAAGFTRDLEAAYRTLWQRYRAGN